MGVVFAAQHASLGSPAAVKLLHPHLVRDASVALRFEREAKAAAMIRHPNVVRILDLVTAEDGARCIVMDLLEGESLGDRIMRVGPLSPEATAALLLPVMHGLADAHRQRIVHRDLKPDNIFIAREAGREVPMLLDFGIAKLLDGTHATQTGMMIGTPAYMSPEQVRGLRDIGPPTDVWAMGAVWFECLSGRTPLLAETPQGMIASILTEAPPPLRTVKGSVPSHLADVIDRALKKDLSERYPDMSSFAAALRAALGSRAVEALAATMLPTPSPAAGPASMSSVAVPVETPLPHRDPAADARHLGADAMRDGAGDRQGGSSMNQGPATGMTQVPTVRRARTPFIGAALMMVGAVGVGAGVLSTMQDAQAPMEMEMVTTPQIPAPPTTTTAVDPATTPETTTLPMGAATPVTETPMGVAMVTAQTTTSQMVVSQRVVPTPITMTTANQQRRPSMHTMMRTTSMVSIDDLLNGSNGGGGSAMSGMSTTTTLSRSEVVSVVRRHTGALRACMDPTLDSFRVNLAIRVDPGGGVSSVTAQGAPNPAIRGCIESEVRTWRFSISSNGLSFTYPFRFEGQ